MKPVSYFTCQQSDLGLRCPNMPRNTFSHGVAQIMLTILENYWEIQVLEENPLYMDEI